MSSKQLSRLMLAASVCISTLTAKMEAQEHNFLTITKPEEKQTFGVGADCKVTGFLHLPDPKTDIDVLLVRIRVYSPGKNQDFVIAQEKSAAIKKAPLGTTDYPFEATLKLPKNAGQYLLKVDCLNLKLAQYPKNLVATQSIFIEVQELTHIDDTPVWPAPASWFANKEIRSLAAFRKGR